MSKILLVHPYKMLQHAFVVALFPDHEVKIVEDLAAAQGAVADADLAIIDAAALRSRGSGPAEEIFTPKNCYLPTIWIDNEKPPRETPKMARLIPPFTKEQLKTAVADLLRAPAQFESAVVAPGHATAPRTLRKEKAQVTKDRGGKKIIELVEVFDEDESAKKQANPSE